MRLLIVTQAVDRQDPVLGFFHAWLLEFAAHVESLTVICLYAGDYAFPENVTVHSLGKERGRRSPLSYAVSFFRLAWQLRDRYDAVFVHMNPEYLLIAGPLWRLTGKRVALWYMHKHVSWRLRLGILFAHAVFTASPRSMRVATKKKRVVGHGINVSDIPLSDAPPYPPLALLTIGRLSPAKRVHVLIEAFAMLRHAGMEAYFTIVGGAAGGAGKRYERELRDMALGLGVADRIVFRGPVPHEEIASLLAESHLFLHASDTGSLDKASLEPLASGVPIVTADPELIATGLAAVLPAEPNEEGFTSAIRHAALERPWTNEIVRKEARAFVLEHHELTRLIPRILADSAFTGHRMG